MDINVFDLDVDEGNADEAARHGVTATELLQVLYGDPHFFPKSAATAPWLSWWDARSADDC